MLTKQEQLIIRLRYFADHSHEYDDLTFRRISIDLLYEAANALDAHKTPLVNDATVTPAKDDRPQTLFGGPIVYSDKPETVSDKPILTVLPSILLGRPDLTELYDKMINEETARKPEDS